MNCDVGVENRVLELRKKVALLRQKTIESQIAKLTQENANLKKEIENLKGEYEKSLIANGKSVSLMASNTSVAASNGPPVNVQETTTTASISPEKKSPKKAAAKKEKSANSCQTTPPVSSKHSKGDEKASFDVSKLDLRLGFVREVSVHPEADGLYVEQIELGDEPGNAGGFGETRTVCSGLVKHMSEDALRNRLVLVICNLKPVKLKGITSQGMVLCATASGEGKDQLIDAPPGSKPGDRVTCKEYPGEPDLPFLNPKKKIWETLKPDLRIDSHGVARFKEAPLEVNGKGLLTCKALRDCQIT